MSYTPKNWQKGDKILASNMNNIEQGVADMSDGYTPKTWVKADKIMASDMNHIEQGIADGGGNPNYKETINGTILAPFGTYNAYDLYMDMTNHNVDALILIDASALGFSTFTQSIRSVGDHIETNGCDENGLANIIQWDTGANLIKASVFDGGIETSLMGYGAYVSTEVTIYHHPMPSTT